MDDGTRGNGLKFYQDLDWILGKISLPKSYQALGWAVQESG